jgi:hypothetical protein
VAPPRKHISINSRGKFELLHPTRGAQAALMTLRPGGVSDKEPGNEHPASEQWVFVISGTGEALVGKKCSSLRRTKIRERSLVLIEQGESRPAPMQFRWPPRALFERPLREDQSLRSSIGIFRKASSGAGEHDQGE